MAAPSSQYESIVAMLMIPQKRKDKICEAIPESLGLRNLKQTSRISPIKLVIKPEISKVDSSRQIRLSRKVIKPALDIPILKEIQVLSPQPSSNNEKLRLIFKDLLKKLSGPGGI